MPGLTRLPAYSSRGFGLSTRGQRTGHGVVHHPRSEGLGPRRILSPCGRCSPPPPPRDGPSSPRRGTPERAPLAFHSFRPLGAKPMTGCFLLPRPMARRSGCACSAARGVSTGVTSRGTPGRAVEGGQPVRAGWGLRTARLGFRRFRSVRPHPYLKQMMKIGRLLSALSDHSTGALARSTSSAQVMRGTAGFRARPTRSLGESGPSFAM